jgi:hypothetical protein
MSQYLTNKKKGVKIVPQVNATFYEDVLDKLEDNMLKDAPSCELYISFVESISDNQKRLAVLESILNAIKPHFERYVPSECFPRSARQLAHMSNHINLFIFSAMHSKETIHPVIRHGIEETSAEHLSTWIQNIEYKLTGRSFIKKVTNVGTLQMPKNESRFTTDSTLAIVSKNDNNYTITSMNQQGKKIFISVCSPPSRAVVIKERSIHKLGLHRELRTVVEFSDECQRSDREIYIYEHLTTAVYVDIYELEDLRRVMMLKNASVPVFKTHIYNDKVSVETSSIFSAPIYIRFTTNVKQVGNVWRAELNVPIHFRYQEPSFELEFRNASVLAPQYIFVDSCEDKSNITELNDIMDIFSSSRTEYRMDDKRAALLGASGVSLKIDYENSRTIYVPIPVGQLAKQQFVTNITLVVTMFSALVLIATACFSPSKIKVA